MKSVEIETDSATTVGTSGPETTSNTSMDIDPDKDGYFDIQLQTEIDILFVMDNSASMAEEQRVLSRDIGALLDVLDAKGADVHMGFTTTDMGNPRCATSDTGLLQLQSCRDRLELDFYRQTQGGDLLFDGRFACEDYCTQETHLKLSVGVWPSESGKNDGAIQRKWIDWAGGETNLPAATSLEEAFRCYAPQGINGCGFESQLEAMYTAILQNDIQGSDNYGFLRDSAALSVIVVTDEYDCSHNPAYNEIFTPANKVFWSDMGANAAQNAVCWNAGTKCTGGGPYQCSSANYASDGTEILDPNTALDNAVLYPVQRYIDQVAARDGVVSVIAGVPIGYEQGGDVVYAQATDPDYQIDNGIGPGCTSLNEISVDPFPCWGTGDCPAGSICTENGECGPPGGDPLPPVRMIEWAEAFAIDGARNVYSICADDYTPALTGIADQIGQQLQAACYPDCAADMNSSTPEVDPECEVYVGSEMTPIQPCIDMQGVLFPPPGDTICYGVRGDQDGNQTPSSSDNLSPECAQKGYNLEFFTVQQGVPKPETIEVKCNHSKMKEVDCPLL